MSLKSYLQSVRVRETAATRTPWIMMPVKSVENWFKIQSPSSGDIVSGPTWSNENGLTAKQSKADHEFIAHARADIPNLVNMLSRSVEVLHYAKGQLEHAGYTKNAVPVINELLADLEKIAEGK